MLARMTALPSMLAGSMIAEIGGYAMPFIVGGVARAYGIPEGWIGFIIAGQIGCAALVSILLAPRIARSNRRTLAYAGAVLVVAGYIGSAVSPSAAPLVASRLIGGIGEGLLYASIAAVAAETRDADRTFALIWVAVVSLAVALFLTLPVVGQQVGPRGVFLALGAVTLVLTPLLFKIPARGSVVDPPTDKIHLKPGATAIVLAIVAALLAILANGYWYFLEGIAMAIGLDEAKAGVAMALSAVVALAGPLLAHRIGVRFGRTIPLVAGFLLAGAGALAVTVATDAITLSVAMCVAGTAYVFTLPYLLGLAAAAGGAPLAAVARGGQGIGSALAPAMSGSILVAGGSYVHIGLISFGFAVIAIAPLVFFSRSVRSDPS